jgi:Tol biopolymer transport system component
MRLRLMPLMGGTPRPFLPDGAGTVVWSPDRSRLAFFTVANGDPIFVADGTGGNPRRIFVGKSGDDHNHFPAWSPDGQWIYFVHGRQSVSEYDLWRVPSKGGAGERLTHRNTDVRYVTPIDSRTVLFVAPDESNAGPWLWALDVERKIARRVSTGLEQYTSLAASADGRRLVASVATPSVGLWSVPILDRPAGNADATPYAVPAVRARAPRFAGRSAMYFLSSRGAGDDLWRVQDGEAQEIWKGADGGLIEPPSVSPNGDWIAVTLGKRSGLTLVSADGAVHHALAERLTARGTSAWSPDATSIVVGGEDDQGPGLFRIQVNDGIATRLLRAEAYDPVWSPDGGLIVYTLDREGRLGLRAMRPDGQAVDLPPEVATPRVAARAHRRMATTRFLPDGSGFVFMKGPTGAEDFWLFDRSSNTARVIASVSKPSSIGTFDVTPDGARLVFDRVEDRSNLVLIDRRR